MKNNIDKATLKKYAAIATSAFVAGTKLSHGQILYTDIDPDDVYTPENRYSINIDDEGADDITFKLYSYYYTYYYATGPSGYYSKTWINSYFKIANYAYSGEVDVLTKYGGNQVKPLEDGDDINPDDVYFVGAYNRYIHNGSANYDAFYQTPQISNNYDFANQGDKYIAVRMDLDDDGEYNAGWILVNVEGVNWDAVTKRDYGRMTVKSFAYDQVEGRNLVAGVTSSPSLEVQGTPESATTSTAFTLTFEFGENVSGFTIDDISVDNGSASNFQTTDANTYTADITPDGVGNVVVSVDHSSAASVATTQGSDPTEVTIDLVPTVEILNAPNIVNSNAFEVTFEFSEDVANFTVEDITVTNATVDNFQTTDGNTYTADITPDGNGHITIDVNAAVAQSLSEDNDNLAAEQVTVEYDGTAPTVSIDAPASVTGTDPFSITIEFNEEVDGFTIADITVSNGTASNLEYSEEDDDYSVTITPSGAGNITIDVAADVAEDEAGNNNVAATQASITYNEPAPTLGLDDELAAKITLYPNPTTDFVTIESPEMIRSVQVTSAVGKQIQIPLQTNVLNFKQAAPGIYVIRIGTDKGTIIKRIVRN